jgi:hypothetical protein
MHYLKHFLKICTHKWYVFRYGLTFNIAFWQLLKHDWHKFLPDEFIPYAKHFGSPDGQYRDEFDKAVKLHWSRGKHHWNHWATPDGPKPMPDKYILEMVADWHAASRQYTGSDDITEWFNNFLVKNHDNLHDYTIIYLYILLNEGLNYLFNEKVHKIFYEAIVRALIKQS